MSDRPTSDRPIVTRFAPSPTGLLHLGNARTALIAWLAARRSGGRFILRIDDTDAERGSPALEAAILEDLRWLGLDWDGFLRQSDRKAEHDRAIERLRAGGRLYPCWETPEELALQRRAALAAGRPPIYDRAALRLPEAERARLEAEGRRPHWRFRLEPGEIAWEDRVRGPVRFRAEDLSDPVLLREDGTPLYHVGSVVDDIATGVTLVVRGEDHVANTALHIQLFAALGAAPPDFAHLPLLVDEAGRGLSKRLGSLSLRSLREEEGLEPMAVASLLATIGTSAPVAAHRSLDELVRDFDFGRIGRAPPRLAVEDLVRLNAALIHGASFAAMQDRLAALGLEDIDADGWAAIRPNLERLREAADLWRMVRGPILPGADAFDAEGLGVLAAARDTLPAGRWDTATWKVWTGAIAARTGLRGRALFLPLRLALTGQAQGPELRDLLPILGRDRVKVRLDAALATPSGAAATDPSRNDRADPA